MGDVELRLVHRLEQMDEDSTDIIMFLCRRHRIQTIVLDRVLY